MVTTSLDLLDACHQAVLEAQTSAEERVYRPGDWPTQPGQYPIVKMRLVSETRQSLGCGGPPEFRTIATIRFLGEVSAPAKLDDVGASDAEIALWNLKRQLEVAVIGNFAVTQMTEQTVSVQTQLAFNSEAASHLAGIQMDVSLQFYEGPESFAPEEDFDLAEVDTTLTSPAASINIPTV